MQPRKFIPMSFLTQAQIRQARVRAAQSKGTHTEQEWQNVLAECNGECPRCLKPMEEVEKDHAIPVCEDGSTESIWNIQALCKKCNREKGASNVNWRMLKRMEEKLSSEEGEWMKWMIRKAYPTLRSSDPTPDANSTKEHKELSGHVLDFLATAAGELAVRLHAEDSSKPNGYDVIRYTDLADLLEEYRPNEGYSWHEMLKIPESPDMLLKKLIPKWNEIPVDDRTSLLLKLNESMKVMDSISEREEFLKSKP